MSVIFCTTVLHEGLEKEKGKKKITQSPNQWNTCCYENYMCITSSKITYLIFFVQSCLAGERKRISRHWGTVTRIWKPKINLGFSLGFLLVFFFSLLLDLYFRQPKSWINSIFVGVRDITWQPQMQTTQTASGNTYSDEGKGWRPVCKRLVISITTITWEFRVLYW